MSQVSDEYRHRQSETVSVKTAYAPTRRPYFGAVLRRRHQLARVRWCNRAKLEESLVQRWIKINAADNRWLYRRRNERLVRNCVLGVDNFGGESVMMWGVISYARKTQLVHIPGNLTSTRYRDEVLAPHILPAMNLRREIFQHNTRLTQLVLLTF